MRKCRLEIPGLSHQSRIVLPLMGDTSIKEVSHYEFPLDQPEEELSLSV